jgi:hypothetical protein
MTYIKSALVGLFTLFIATIAYVVIFPFVYLRMYPPPPGVAHVGFDLRVFFTNPLYWLIAIAAFALGFYWEFRSGQIALFQCVIEKLTCSINMPRSATQRRSTTRTTRACVSGSLALSMHG